jgi:hypothetical protein
MITKADAPTGRGRVEKFRKSSVGCFGGHPARFLTVDP